MRRKTLSLSPGLGRITLGNVLPSVGVASKPRATLFHKMTCLCPSRNQQRFRMINSNCAEKPQRTTKWPHLASLVSQRQNPRFLANDDPP